MSYELLVAGEDGRKYSFEQRSEEHPFYFLTGSQNILPKLEEALIGKEQGEELEVEISYEDGYGDYDESKIIWLPISTFRHEGKLDKSMLQVGKVLNMRDEHGHHMPAEIKKVEPLRVQMDFNHPLASFDLTFRVKVMDVRLADAEEIAHGHVHGPGGHHH